MALSALHLFFQNVLVRESKLKKRSCLVRFSHQDRKITVGTFDAENSRKAKKFALTRIKGEERGDREMKGELPEDINKEWENSR